MSHSPSYDSVMYPYYRGPVAGGAVGYDDVLAMYEMYSKLLVSLIFIILTENIKFEVTLGMSLRRKQQQQLLLLLLQL